MLLGLGYRPEAGMPSLDYRDDHHALATFDAIRREAGRLVQTLPSLHSYLSQRYEQDKGHELAFAAP
jgi:hypothetical protein